jgi:hypothetical protein
MSGPVQRWKSAVLLGGVFTLGICAIALVGATLPVYGDLISEAMYFGAPLTWVLIKTKMLGATSGPLVALATIAPYPLVGMIAGYGWPLDFSAKTRLFRPIAQRFVVTGLVLGSISFLLGLWVMPGVA